MKVEKKIVEIVHHGQMDLVFSRICPLWEIMWAEHDGSNAHYFSDETEAQAICQQRQGGSGGV